jgi:ribonuclease P protein component
MVSVSGSRPEAGVPCWQTVAAGVAGVWLSPPTTRSKSVARSQQGPSGASARSRDRFSACDRIKKRSEFQKIQNCGLRVVTPGFVFLIGPGGSAERPRLGITASRRVGNAVVRNRAKRLVRAAFRALRSELPDGLDLVVIVRQGLAARGLEDVLSEWRAHQGRIIRRWSQQRVHPTAMESSESAAPIALPVKNSC